jgi:hypothetical protein
VLVRGSLDLALLDVDCLMTIELVEGNSRLKKEVSRGVMSL